MIHFVERHFLEGKDDPVKSYQYRQASMVVQCGHIHHLVVPNAFRQRQFWMKKIFKGSFRRNLLSSLELAV